MAQLANSSVGDLFTISSTDWTAINQRVGSVLAAQKIAAIIASDLPGYPALLASSKLWTQSTFNDLINQSNALVSYSDTAITDFTALNDKVKAITGDSVPEAIQQETKDLLNKLNTDTAPLIVTSDKLSKEVLDFLNNNKIVDGQIAENKETLGTFWAPLGEIITALETASGHVTGAWRAINDDLKIASSSTVSVTFPFLESLQLDVAIASWAVLKEEASVFPSMVDGQENYWTST